VRTRRPRSRIRKANQKYRAFAKKAEQDGADLDDNEFYLCPVCGNIEFGKPPEQCPICGAKGAKFVKY